MRFICALLGMTFAAAATLLMAADPADKKDSQTTKAAYLITGLHCPPCTRTVESSLARVQGIRSAKVDWKTKTAQIEFDEKVVAAQTIAQRLASTQHMMGGNMQYGGWLALKAPEVKDEAAAKKVKATLSGIKGVKQVVTYPQQQSVAVQFDAQGKLTTRDLVDALAKAGVKASN
jgi:copper chaperone CopZ